MHKICNDNVTISVTVVKNYRIESSEEQSEDISNDWGLFSCKTRYNRIENCFSRERNNF